VAYRSGALVDLAEVTRLAREAGALVLWDLSHAAGAVPADLTAAGADLAVGCTYKYLTVGTPPVLAMAAVEVGARLVAEAGIERLAAKGQELTDLLVALADEWLAGSGVTVASPRDAVRRGSHVSLAHPQAWQLTQALLDRGVVPDFRTPDRVRFGPAPLYTRFVDVWDAMDRLRSLLAEGAHETYPTERARVT
jgi:kynureninase